jgi:hypothetical protein
MWQLSQGLRPFFDALLRDGSGTIQTTGTFGTLGTCVSLQRFERSEAVERLKRLERTDPAEFVLAATKPSLINQQITKIGRDAG